MADPEERAEISRTAAGHLRRVGNLDYLAYAIGNLGASLFDLGDWDGWEAVLAEAAISDEMAENYVIVSGRAELAAHRGDDATASAMLAKLHESGLTEEPQQLASVSLIEAYVALARGQLADALRHSRASLAHVDAIGLRFAAQAWSLAARLAFQLHDSAATGELLEMLDSYPPGRVPPMLRAERDLARARLASRAGDADAGGAFESAIRRLRVDSYPYHLAHALLDYAEHLRDAGDEEALSAAFDEAGAIGRRLRCVPLLDRAAAIERAKSPAEA